jgi:hypothetical protein
VVRLPVADQVLPSEEEKAPPRHPLAAPDTVPEGHRILGAFYRAIVDQAGAHLADLVATVADGAPVLLHCAAGKDRTGTVVALALSLAGVRRDAVVADYVASADRIEGVFARLRASPSYGDELSERKVADVTPQAGSMETFLDEVDRRYGGVHGLAMAIGVDEETVARLAARLVDGPHR